MAQCVILSNKNVETSKYIVFGGNSIESVNKIKIIINENLKLDDQTRKCVSKASIKVNMLKRMSKKTHF